MLRKSVKNDVMKCENLSAKMTDRIVVLTYCGRLVNAGEFRKSLFMVE